MAFVLRDPRRAFLRGRRGKTFSGDFGPLALVAYRLHSAGKTVIQ